VNGYGTSGRLRDAARFAAQACSLLAAGGILHGADISTEQRLKQLEQQNQSLQKQLQQQQGVIEDLARKLANVSSPKSDPETGAPPPKRDSTFGTLRISGEGGVGVFHTSSDGNYRNTDLRVDEARLFFEAPLWENYVFAFGEMEILTRERQTLPGGGNPIDDGVHLGELYVDFESVSRLWNKPGMLGIRIGRIDVPFGEEYLVRDVIDNPLITHSLTDFWGIDEGIELYGAIGPVDYVFAVQNGGHNMLTDFNRDKALVGRVGWNANNWLRISGSAMRTGALDVEDDNMSELWFGNGFFRGPFFGATTFEATVYELDAQARWKTGHFKAAGGYAKYSDNSPAFFNSDRDIYFYYAEAVQKLPDHPRLYGALRVSQIFADDGMPIVGLGDFGEYFYGDLTDRISRFSAGLGYNFSDHLHVKVEYALERRHTLMTPSENTHFVGAEVGFAF
jgi:hypothetical protein